MMSTLARVLLGHVHNGLMVNLHADNAKLRGRARHIVSSIANVAPQEAEAALRKARNDTKLAVLLAAGCGIETAPQLLKDHSGHLGPCLTAIASEHTR